jgi:hypothetical protein
MQALSSLLVKTHPRLLMFVLTLASALASAAQDAAVEAQEGNVEHWIEYYKKERDGGNETVTKEPTRPTPQSTDGNDAAPDDRNEQAPASDPGPR